MATARPLSGVSGAGAASPRLALTILFLVVMLNLVDRQLINILAQDIKVDLGLSDVELGLLTGTAFGLLKALFSPPIGSYADRGNRPRILAGLMGLCGAFTMLCGAAGSFAALAIARMGVGVGESAVVPVSTAVIRDYFPRRATSAIAAVMAGSPVGTFLAFLVGGAIAERYGWRWAFLTVGAPGLLLALVVARKLRDFAPAPRSPGMGGSWAGDAARLVRKPLMKPLMCATVGSMFMVSATNAWIPAYFIRVHGLGTATAGLYGAVAIGAGGALGALSGTFCDMARLRSRNPESLVMLTSLLLALPLLFATIFARGALTALGAFFAYNIAAYAWLGPTIRLIQDAVEPRERALATALCSAAGVLVGLGVGLPLIGFISDRLTPDWGPPAVGLATCGVVSVAIAISFISHLVIQAGLRRLAASDNNASPSDKKRNHP